MGEDYIETGASRAFEELLPSMILSLAQTDVDIEVSDDIVQCDETECGIKPQDGIVTVSRPMSTILEQDSDMSNYELFSNEHQRHCIKHKLILLEHLISFLRRFSVRIAHARPDTVVDISSVALNVFYYFQQPYEDLNNWIIKAGGLCEHVNQGVYVKAVQWIRGLSTQITLSFGGSATSDNGHCKMARYMADAATLSTVENIEQDVEKMKTEAESVFQTALNACVVDTKEYLVQQYTQQVNFDLNAVLALMKMAQTNYRLGDELEKVVVDLRSTESTLHCALMAPPLISTRTFCNAGLSDPFDELLAASESSVDTQTARLLCGIWFQTNAQRVYPHLRRCESFLRTVTMNSQFLHPASTVWRSGEAEAERLDAELRTYTGRRLGYYIRAPPSDAILEGSLCIKAAVRYRTTLLVAELHQRGDIPAGFVAVGVCRTAINKATAGTMAALIQMKARRLERCRGMLMLHSMREMETVGGQFQTALCLASSALRLFSSAQLQQLLAHANATGSLQHVSDTLSMVDVIATRKAADMIVTGVIGLRQRCHMPVLSSENASVIQILDSRLLTKYTDGHFVLRPREMRSHRAVEQLLHTLGSTGALGVHLQHGYHKRSVELVVIDKDSPILEVLRRMRQEWPARYG